MLHPFFQEVYVRMRPLLPDLQIEKAFSTPPQFEYGQLAFACHFLSKTFKKSPNIIADELAKQYLIQLQQNPSLLIQSVTPLNGYINFSCNFKALAEFLIPRILDKTFFHPPLDPAERYTINIEFSQPNTHKALHVGHLRNMIFGESICRLLSYIGHTVIRCTYPGDLGTHILKVLWFLEKKNIPLPSTQHARWLSEIYVAAVKEYKNLSPEEETAAKNRMKEILFEVEHHKEPLFSLYTQTRQWSLDEMRSVYTWLKIEFDEWFFESECDQPSRKLVLDLWKEGKLIQSQGAIGKDLSEYGLGFALLLKSDQTGLYLTKDLELLRRKLQYKNVNRCLFIVDSRQKLHFQQLFKVSELLGMIAAAHCQHLSYEIVTTEQGEPFSSRHLQGHDLQTVKEALCQKVIQNYLVAYEHLWTTEEIQTCANQIALGALKYGFLKVDASKMIRFILEDWIQLDGDTGPYLQYTVARCYSILEKINVPLEKVSITALNHIEEKLFYHLSTFVHFTYLAAVEHRPCILTSYLYDTAKLFNRFYKESPIRNSEPAVQQTRLYLVNITLQILLQGLDLLNIQAPKRM